MMEPLPLHNCVLLLHSWQSDGWRCMCRAAFLPQHLHPPALASGQLALGPAAARYEEVPPSIMLDVFVHVKYRDVSATEAKGRPGWKVNQRQNLCLGDRPMLSQLDAAEGRWTL